MEIRKISRDQNVMTACTYWQSLKNWDEESRHHAIASIGLSLEEKYEFLFGQTKHDQA